MTKYLVRKNAFILFQGEKGFPYTATMEKGGTLEVEGDTVRYIDVGTMVCRIMNCGIPYGKIEEHKSVKKLTVGEDYISYTHEGTIFRVRNIQKI